MRSLPLLLIALATVNCGHKLESSRTSDTTTAICASGELTPWHLTPLGFTPSSASLKFADARTYEPLVPEHNFTLQLDTCAEVIEGSDRLLLARAILWFGGHTQYTFQVADGDRVKGLVEALLQGNVEALQIELRRPAVEYNYYKGLLVLGRRDRDRPFVVTAPTQPDGNRWLPGLPLVLVGNMEFGSASQSSRCSLGENEINGMFHYDSLTVEYAGCGFPGGGQTAGYRYLSLAFTDCNPLLKPAQRERWEITTEHPKWNDIVAYEYRHHNQGDHLLVTTPHATYQFRSDFVVKESQYTAQYRGHRAITIHRACPYYNVDCTE